MIQAHRNRYQNKTSNDVRQRIISAVVSGGSQELASRMFSVKPWTVRVQHAISMLTLAMQVKRIMDKFYATGETDKGKHGGHKPKLITEEHCVFLRELMGDDCTVTLDYMQEQLEALSGLRVGLTTIHNRIIGFHYSFKVVKKHCMAAVTEAVKEHRRQFSLWLMNAVMWKGEILFSLMRLDSLLALE